MLNINKGNPHAFTWTTITKWRQDEDLLKMQAKIARWVTYRDELTNLMSRQCCYITNDLPKVICGFPGNNAIHIGVIISKDSCTIAIRRFWTNVRNLRRWRRWCLHQGMLFINNFNRKGVILQEDKLKSKSIMNMNCKIWWQDAIANLQIAEIIYSTCKSATKLCHVRRLNYLCVRNLCLKGMSNLRNSRIR